MKTFGTSRLIFLCYLAACLLFSPGCSHNKDADTAEKYFSDALAAIREHNFDDAELLLEESRAIYLNAENSDKFFDVTVELARVARVRGKLSTSISLYDSARSYYEWTHDASKLIFVGNALADLYALTGKRDSATILSSIAMRLCVLSVSDTLKANSEFQRGRVELMFHNPATATMHFSAASMIASRLSNPRLSFETALYFGAALTALDKKDEAITKLKEAERWALTSGDTLAFMRVQAELGITFLHFGLYEPALQAFTAGLKFDSLDTRFGQTVSPSGRSDINEMRIQCLSGIGEVYLANYAQTDARIYFSKALMHARADKNTAMTGYCLARMADCTAQHAMPAPTALSVMLASALYEQAFAMFEYDASPQRIAVVLVKQAILRSALHEDGDADRLFRKAFDLMRTASVLHEMFSEPGIVTNDLRLLPESIDSSDWWFRPYASFLIHKRRIGDALAIFTDGMAAISRAELLTYPLDFQDTTRSKRVGLYSEHVRAKALAEYELMVQQTLPQSFVDTKDNKQTQARCRVLRDDVLSEGIRLVARYPSLLPIVTTPPLSIETIQTRVSDDASLVSFVSLGERFYAIVVKQNSSPIAVDLGASATMIDRIHAYNSLLLDQMKRPVETHINNAALRSASLRLAADLIQPIEQFITHRVIVHATNEINRLPIHALLLETGLPLSNTYDVSYAPFLGATTQQADRPPLDGVVVFGAPSVRQIETEFVFRSIKNFYTNTSFLIMKSATLNNFLSASGGLLHFVTHYNQDAETSRPTFSISGGRITIPEVQLPISYFLMSHPFRAWVLADERSDFCDLTLQHAAFALMSGATEVIAQQYPCPQTYTKDFNEHLYSNLSKSGDPRNAYSETLGLMQKSTERNSVYSGAPFFFIEW